MLPKLTVHVKISCTATSVEMIIVVGVMLSDVTGKLFLSPLPYMSSFP